MLKPISVSVIISSRINLISALKAGILYTYRLCTSALVYFLQLFQLPQDTLYTSGSITHTSRSFLCERKLLPIGILFALKPFPGTSQTSSRRPQFISLAGTDSVVL